MNNISTIYNQQLKQHLKKVEKHRLLVNAGYASAESMLALIRQAPERYVPEGTPEHEAEMKRREEKAARARRFYAEAER